MSRFRPIHRRLHPGVQPPALPQVELPQGYYLDNFHTLLDFVNLHYDDILSDDEKSFSDTFHSFSSDAQKLYVRLISRKGPQFRSDSLNYFEIGGIMRASVELKEKNFLSIDGYEIDGILLKLLRVRELRELLSNNQQRARISGKGLSGKGLSGKNQLIEHILKNLDEGIIRSFFKDRFQVFSPLRVKELEMYRLLFFGNLYQDLTEFVLLDLGLQRFESYKLTQRDRLFQSRILLETTYEMIQIEQNVQLGLENQDNESLVSIAGQIPDPLAEPRLIRKRGKVLNGIGRYFERRGDLPSALKCFRLTDQPPSRERQVRILDKTGSAAQALKLCKRIQTNPLEQAELEFADVWLARKGKKVKSPSKTSSKTSLSEKNAFTVAFETVRIKRCEEIPVEINVLTHYLEKGWQGFFSHNFFWTGLFGLAFWDIIFMPFRGAFFNMFQRGPTDLFLPDFQVNRAEPIRQCLDKISADVNWEESILHTYDTKYGVSNYLVNWNLLTREHMKLALPRLNRAHLVTIFERLSKDLRENTNGFPDLLLFPPPGNANVTNPRDGSSSNPSSILVEVKSPNDQIQNNQMRWMKFFHTHEIPYRVAKVIWSEE